MSKITQLKGLCLKKDSFTGINKNKCKVLALWGKYLAEEPFDYNELENIHDESDSESVSDCPNLVFDNKGTETVDVLETDTKTPNTSKNTHSSDVGFVCDHELDNTGYITVKYVKKKTITWNDKSVDKKGEPLSDLELEWDNDLNVYLSTNESSSDDKTWIRILEIV